MRVTGPFPAWAGRPAFTETRRRLWGRALAVLRRVAAAWRSVLTDGHSACGPRACPRPPSASSLSRRPLSVTPPPCPGAQALAEGTRGPVPGSPWRPPAVLSECSAPAARCWLRLASSPPGLVSLKRCFEFLSGNEMGVTESARGLGHGDTRQRALAHVKTLLGAHRACRGPLCGAGPPGQGVTQLELLGSDAPAGEEKPGPGAVLSGSRSRVQRAPASRR